MLRIRPGVRLLSAGTDRVCWVTELQQGIWTSPHAGTLAQLFSKATLSESLLENFAPGTDRDQAAETVQSMISLGLIDTCSSHSSLYALCYELRVDPQHLKRNRWLQGATIIAPTAEIGAAVESGLAARGILPGTQGLTILAVNDYLDGRAAHVARSLQESKTPFMLAKFGGEETWIGPVFQWNHTPCWNCLEIRLREHRWLEAQVSIGPSDEESSVSHSRLHAESTLAAHEAARWLLDAPNALDGAIWSFSWTTLASRRHVLLRHASCPCARNSSDQAESGELPLSRHFDFRQKSAEQILQRLENLCSPVTGILRRFEHVEMDLPAGMHAYGAVYCAPLPDKERRIQNAILEPAVTAGTGWSAREAKAACLAEAVERYSTRFYGGEEVLRGSYRELGEAAVHPNEVSLFSAMQFSSREQWNKEHNQGEAVPDLFDEQETLEWIRGRSLTHKRERFLPIALAKLYYCPPGTRWIGDADSSGCAAGHSMEEAILYALFELVERDGLGIWWFNRTALPWLRPECVEDPRTLDICRHLEARGWRIWFHDLTTDLGIPTAVAIAQNAAGEWVLGSAAHLHGPTALRRAVVELCQLSLARVRGGPAPPRTEEPVSKMNPGPLRGGEHSLQTLLDTSVDLVARTGHETIAIDLTRRDIDFAVVRVVAPGLRHKKPRYAPGRLYDVPVRLGWHAAPLAESEMRLFGV